jgi:hypothetical protein
MLKYSRDGTSGDLTIKIMSKSGAKDGKLLNALRKLVRKV